MRPPEVREVRNGEVPEAMSEWLGKPKLRRSDVQATHPSLVKDFPSIADYFVEDQKFRVTVTLEPDETDRFRGAVEKRFGEFNADTARRGAQEAVRQWLGAKRKR